MKVTLLVWDRREGKTTDLAKMAQDREDVMFLVMNHNEEKRVKYEFRHELIETDVKSFNKRGIESRLRGTRPKTIIIDNAEYLDEDVFNKEIAPLAMEAEELIMAGSSNEFVHFIVPERTKWISITKRSHWRQFWLNRRKNNGASKCNKYGGYCYKDNECPALRNPRGGDFGWGECIHIKHT